MVVRVTNTGRRTIPNVAVTVTNPSFGDAAQSFGLLIPAQGQGQPIIANRSRPIWIVMREPGPCAYSCRNGGPGGAATEYTDTWALGRLAPGATARFDWRVEAVRAGRFAVRWQVAASLNGHAKAVNAAGQAAAGRLQVRISSSPRRAYVKNDGQVVYSP